MTTVAVLERETVSLDAGEHVSLPLEVRNDGDTVEDYHLELVGVPAQWTTIDHSEFTLYPGTSTVATLDVHPPRSSEVPAGRLRFGIRVVPVDHPEEAVVPEAVVEVLPYLETTAELVPRTSRGRMGATHQVAVDNRGNVPVMALLALADPGQLVRVDAVLPAVSVLPGQAVFAEVRVRPLARLWRGTPRTIPFTVTVSPQDSSSVVLEGAHLQEPLIPAWLGKALLALLALLLLLAALWYWLLRPAVQSAAKEAAAESIGAPAKEAATSAQAAEQAQGEAATAAEQAAVSASKAAKSEAKVSGPPPPKTVTAPFSGRLVATTAKGSTAADSFAVPKGQTLSLTDLVLENSQGDEGLMRVTVDGTDILVQALESFRTTDYHFVTPFVAPAGSRVVMTVDCRRVGAPPGVTPAPSTCSNALTFGGPLTQPAPQE
jgi:biotin carboxyl carrier protein